MKKTLRPRWSRKEDGVTFSSGPGLTREKEKNRVKRTSRTKYEKKKLREVAAAILTGCFGN